MKTIIKIDANIPWMAKRDVKSDTWVAICDPLSLTVEGDTWGELVSVVDEAMDHLFRDLLRNDQLDAFLQRRGWKQSGLMGRASPEMVSDIRFDIPTDLHKATAS